MRTMMHNMKNNMNAAETMRLNTGKHNVYLTKFVVIYNGKAGVKHHMI